MSKLQRGTNRPLRRQAGKLRPRRTFQIFCEGTRTEPEYLAALKRQPFVRDVASVDLRVDTGRSGSVPRTLVSSAIQAKERAKAGGADVDEFWCVFDVEWPQNHPDLAPAIDEAARAGIQVAVSNPCFELWLILHFRNQTGWLDSDDACRQRCAADRSPDKGIDPSKYMDRVAEAEERAKALAKQHAADGTVFPQDNPSSGMYGLLSAIRTPRKPE